jgi:hypothetical protein
MRCSFRRVPWGSVATLAAIVLVIAAFAATIAERAIASGGDSRDAIRALIQVAGLAIAVGVSLVRKLRAAADRIEDEQDVPASVADHLTRVEPEAP